MHGGEGRVGKGMEGRIGVSGKGRGRRGGEGQRSGRDGNVARLVGCVS